MLTSNASLNARQTVNSDGRAELGARSLTSAVYERVRRDIITNALVQGAKLQMGNLQDQYGVSLSVVREALSRLVADGLVVAEAQRGFRVSAISREDLIDVMRTRIGIEGMAIEQAIEHGDAVWLASVEQAYERLSTTVRTCELEKWGTPHDEFHHLLVAPCDSTWLRRFRNTLYEQAERYRYAAVDRAHLPTADEIEAEHRGLLDAVLQRDGGKAKKAIEAHFASTLNHVLAVTARS